MKDKCIYSQTDISKYFLSNLSREKEEEIQIHILECEICKQRLQRLRMLAAEMHKTDEEEDVSQDNKVLIKHPDFTEKRAARPAGRFGKGSIITFIAIAACIASLVFNQYLKETDIQPVNQIEPEKHGQTDSLKNNLPAVFENKTDSVK